MKKLYSLACVFLFLSLLLISSCDLKKEVNYLEQESCIQLFENKADIDNGADSTRYKYHICRLLNGVNLTYADTMYSLDSLSILSGRIVNSYQVDEKFGFFVTHEDTLSKIYPRLFLEGYEAAVQHNDYEHAYMNAQVILKNVNQKDRKQTLRNISENFYKFADNDVNKYLKHFNQYLCRTVSPESTERLKFDGFDNLVRALKSSGETKNGLSEKLERAIKESKVIKKMERVRPKYFLSLMINDEEFEFYDHKISLMYYNDTIVTNQAVTFDYRTYKEVASFYQDTIKNQIPNLEDKRLYIEKARKSGLFKLPIFLD